MNCTTIILGLPFVSTDSARIALTLNIATNVSKTFYSDTFAIRPDPRLGDQPPTITMLTPVAGDSFEAGSLVPITWTAADDESLRSFTIQWSYDGGIGWQTVVDELPGDATSFDWLVPDSEGFADVRVRVIAHDLRFQNSSDGADRAFAIVPGSVGCEGDANGDGAVDPLDSGFVLARFGCPVGTGDPGCDAADQNGDGAVDPLDAGFVLARFGPCQWRLTDDEAHGRRWGVQPPALLRQSGESKRRNDSEPGRINGRTDLSPSNGSTGRPGLLGRINEE